jgi:hypothetical protein|tara:strand:- start:448 stop:696 length:249 start_codon:yes stop_codon:yes gene_type:complete
VNQNKNFDKDRYQASINKLQKIYSSISDSAVDISKKRCPYKNVKDRCTAKFGCRNQDFVDGKDQLALCVGSDQLDYRDAWDV